MGIMGYTHYKTAEPNKHLAFELGECENCGEPVQEANSVWICEPESKLIRMGLKPWDGPLPSESYYSDELNACVCDSCEG